MGFSRNPFALHKGDYNTRTNFQANVVYLGNSMV